jgi:hypothetical protein
MLKVSTECCYWSGPPDAVFFADFFDLLFFFYFSSIWGPLVQVPHVSVLFGAGTRFFFPHHFIPVTEDVGFRNEICCACRGVSYDGGFLLGRQNVWPELEYSGCGSMLTNDGAFLITA